MEAGVISRASERATDAARRASQLEVRLQRLRWGVSLTPEDVRFARQAAERARGRAAGAERDARRARESARAAYKTAAITEAAAAALFRALGRPAEAETHNRMAAEYELLAAVNSGPATTCSACDDSAGVDLPPVVPHGGWAGDVPQPKRAAAMSRHQLSVWHWQLVVGDMAELADLRRALRELLEARGMHSSIVDDLALAVEEITSNGLRHGRPPVQVRVRHDPARVLCEVVDQGPGFDWASATDRPGADDPLAEGRFGLRLAQELCDELTTLKTVEEFVVRMVKNV